MMGNWFSEGAGAGSAAPSPSPLTSIDLPVAEAKCSTEVGFLKQAAAVAPYPRAEKVFVLHLAVANSAKDTGARCARCGEIFSIEFVDAENHAAAVFPRAVPIFDDGKRRFAANRFPGRFVTYCLGMSGPVTANVKELDFGPLLPS